MIGFYLSPRYEVMPGRTRNVLAQIVTYPEMFDEILNLRRGGYGLCKVVASQATHDAIAADGRAVKVTPLFADDVELEAGIDGNVGSVDSTLLQAAKDRMEQCGISAAWMLSTHSQRDVLRYIVRLCLLVQGMVGNGVAMDVLAYLADADLSATVNSVPAATRTRVRNYIQARGLDSSWIAGSTTLREVLHYLISNLGWGQIKALGTRL